MSCLVQKCFFVLVSNVYVAVVVVQMLMKVLPLPIKKLKVAGVVGRKGLH